MLWDSDVYMGRLRAALEQTGMWDNTLIVFVSDNGGAKRTPCLHSLPAPCPSLLSYASLQGSSQASSRCDRASRSLSWLTCLHVAIPFVARSTATGKVACKWLPSCLAA